MRELEVKRDIAYMFRNRLTLRRIPYVDKAKTRILVSDSVYEECLALLKEVEQMAAGRNS